ncbi:hypothetical protein JW848_00905 [Candidatus Bipolaricaulota bacterium]|nr:hypothetical protein [Candidatus Bipolaricaulota bacterium]
MKESIPSASHTLFVTPSPRSPFQHFRRELLLSLLRSLHTTPGWPGEWLGRPKPLEISAAISENTVEYGKTMVRPIGVVLYVTVQPHISRNRKRAVKHVRRYRKKRNEQIVQMSQAGETHAEIARQFKLSRSSIDIIVRRSEEERQLAERSDRILEEVHRADDLDKKWPSVDLIDALRLTATTRNALLKHLRSVGTEEISLRGLMDQVISGLDDKRPSYLVTPLLDLRCIGKIGFFSVVDQLSNLSLGKNCDKEWKKKILILRRCSRLVGTRPGSWSEPAYR